MISCPSSLKKNKTKFSFIIVVTAILLCACATVDTRKTRTLPEPRLNVYIKPQTPYPLHEKTAKLAPIMLPDGYDDTYRRQLTELIRDVFLQHRLFKVIEITFDKVGSREEFAKKSHADGFDFIMIIRSPDFLPASGLSHGWIAMDVLIIHAPTNTTMWHIHSETILSPQMEKDYIIFTSKFKHAPTITQGFISLISAVSNYIRLNS